MGGLAAVGLVAFFAVLFVDSLAGRDYSCARLLAAPPGQTADGFATDSLPATHVSTGAKISYGFCPPTSGPHYNAAGAGPLRPGFYGPNSAAGPGGWVHNLEHGFVVLLYRCAAEACFSDDDLATIQRFVANGPPSRSAAACGYSSKVLAARFDDMTVPFALVAWDRALLLGTLDETAAFAFARRYIEATAPEASGC